MLTKCTFPKSSAVPSVNINTIHLVPPLVCYVDNSLVRVAQVRHQAGDHLLQGHTGHGDM